METQHPIRISLMSFNVWKNDGEPAHWALRKPALTSVVGSMCPDILCIQEAHPTIMQEIQATLPNHQRVIDADNFQGWSYEGNIFWHQRYFVEEAHYIEDIGLPGDRRLFCVRLTVKSDPQHRTILVATAHYTWQGHGDEDTTGRNPRVGYAIRTAEKLKKLARPQEPVFFMGDLNQSFHPARVLRKEGFVDCFTALRLPQLPTHPARPCEDHEEQLPDEVLDWLTANEFATPILANVLAGVRTGAYMHPSDHHPVMAVYQIFSPR